MKKGNVLVIVLGGLAIFSLALVGYLFFQNQQLQKPIIEPALPSPTPNTTDETTNWKTYTNTLYGYEYKCPEKSSHTIEVTNGNGSTIPLYQEGCFEGTNQVRVFVNNINSADYPTEPTAKVVNINSPDNKYKVSLRGFDNNYFDQILSTFKFVNTNKISQCNCSFVVTSGTNIEFLVTSPTGKQTGYIKSNKYPLLDIPSSSYGIQHGISDDTGKNPPMPDINYFGISEAENGTYKLDVIPKQAGKYYLHMGLAFGPPLKGIEASAEGMLTENQFDKYMINIPDGTLKKVSN